MRRLNPEISLGFFVASLLWISVVGWQAAYSPTEKQRDECYEAAKKTGYKADECKSFWERTTSDPIALFNLILAISTVGLWVATIALYRAGEKQSGIAGKAADAATQSAEALVAAEGARLLVVLKGNTLFEVATKYGYWYRKSADSMPQPFTTIPRATFEFRNYGKTPATLVEACISLRYRADPPPRLHESGELMDLTFDTVVSGGQSTVELDAKLDTNLNMSDAVEIIDGVKSVWFSGYIVYTDIFNRTCEQQFLHKLHPGANGGAQRWYDRSYYRKA
jgi:hypothetical protein